MSYWDGTKWLPDRPAAPAKKAPRSRSRDWLATIIMLAGIVVLVFPGMPIQAAGPKLDASPSAVRPGDVVRVSGRGFPARATIQLAWDGSILPMPAVTVTSAGTLDSVVMAPLAPAGRHTLSAVGTADASQRGNGKAATRPIASVTLTVIAPVPVAAATVATPPPATPTPAPTAAPPTAAPPTAAPPTAAPPTAFVPAAGLPNISPAYGTVMRKVFTDGTMGPFRVLTYPDDHIGGAGQFMTVFNRYSLANATVHDGYLDLRATRRADGLWNATLVGTSQDGNGPTFGYGVFRYWLRFNVGHATWQCAWLYDTTSWSATEIDFPEMLENLSMAAHVLGQGAGSKYGIARPGDLANVFHEFKVERRASFVAFSIDGVEVARVNGAMPASKLAILLDSKVGFPWISSGAPSGSTPNSVYLHIAAVTVDP